MKRIGLSLLGMAGLLLAGCKTTEVKPVEWKEQSAFVAKVKDPRWYGYSIFQTPHGIEYRGGSRLHPNQAKMFPMKVEEPFRPVVMMSGKFGKKEPILLDFSMDSSWMEFKLAKDLHAVPVNEGAAQFVNIPGDEIPGCISMVPRVRLGGILIENPLVYVRMATGPMGRVARGIEKPQIKGVIGWGILKQFEQIHLDYVEEKVALSTANVSYNPDPSMLIARIPLVAHTGSCFIRGKADGKPTLILIDPAGDYDVATDDAQSLAELQLSEGLSFTSPAVSKSIGGTRIGARLLQNYRVTICPRAGMIYFEKPETEK